MGKGNAIMIAFGHGHGDKMDKSKEMGDGDDLSSPDLEGEEGDVGEDAAAAGEEFAKAVKAGDGKLIAMAFKNLQASC